MYFHHPFPLELYLLIQLAAHIKTIPTAQLPSIIPQIIGLKYHSPDFYHTFSYPKYVNFGNFFLALPNLHTPKQPSNHLN